MRLTRYLTPLILLLALSACVPRYVVRDSTTFATETAAALARQQEAASALLEAAEAALEDGDLEACREYAEPALLIEASAQAQAYRALWLAGLTYPAEDGSVPPHGTEQPDPGPSDSPRPVAEVCPDLPVIAPAPVTPRIEVTQ